MRHSIRGMSREPSSGPGLGAGLVFSLLVHVVGAAMIAWWAADAPAGGRLPQINAEAIEPEEETKTPERLRLGLEESSAVSVTWIGFTEFKEHSARQSEVEQPELSNDPAPGVPTSVAAAPASPPPTAPATLSEPAAPAATPIAEPSIIESPAPAAVAEEALEPTESPSPPAQSLPPGDTVDGPTGDAPIDEPAEPAEPDGAPESPPAESITTNEQPVTPEPELAPAPEPEPPSTPPAPNNPAQQSAAPSKKPSPQLTQPAAQGSGAQSNKESDASSIVSVDLKKLGQPIAGHGLEIQTKRANFSKYTRIMGAARSPIVRVHFRHDGKVERVEFLRSSGNPDVDRPIKDALYEWVASGKILSTLRIGNPPETLPVEFRVIL